ncbi:LysR family transcriptional regulator [Kribbella sp. NPDC051770]|uniref:LysR family transcriptional regulator n=1 Tax=Kribbella sp. NPDC051770 TaxID=3155413 RepID=UPI003418097F
MELRHLRHFVALGEERSFTRAAEREHIVQSGLSTSIRALEREVGALLFVRGTRPVRLTAEGLALLPAARHTLDSAAAAQQAVQDAHGVLAGQLRIGALQTSGHRLPFSAWLAEFALAHPGVDISVQQLPGMQMIDLVVDGRLDCALVSPTIDRIPGLDVTPLDSEPIVLTAPLTHPLAQRESITLADLDGERFVEPPAQWAIRAMVDGLFREAGLTRRVACEVNEWTMVLDLVAAGVGLTLTPTGFDLTPSVAARVRQIPVTDLTTHRRLDLVLPQGHAATPAARRFRELVLASR